MEQHAESHRDAVAASVALELAKWILETNSKVSPTKLLKPLQDDSRGYLLGLYAECLKAVRAKD